MKNRVIVMNGQRILQEQSESNKWKDINVNRAEGLKPGIYNIFTSKDVDKTVLDAIKEFSGQIIHHTAKTVIQKSGNGFYGHDKNLFGKLPAVGSFVNIKYDESKKITVSNTQAQKSTRKMTI